MGSKATTQKPIDTDACYTAGKHGKWAGTDIVRVVITCNPKRLASDSRDRFGKRVDGQTVAAYRQKCTDMGAPKGKWREDMVFDTNGTRRYIVCVPAESHWAKCSIDEVRAAVSAPPRGFRTDPANA